MINYRSFSCPSPAPAPSTPRFLCKGLTRPSSFSHPATSTMELEEEIVTLQIEILRLERYLLYLYRTALLDQLPTTSPSNNSHHHNTKSPSLPVPDVKLTHDWKNKLGFHHHDHEPLPANEFSISSSSSRSSSIFSKLDTPAKEKRSYSSKHRSLADHFGAAPFEDTIYAPDRLSQEIVRCISSVYRKLADTPHGHGSSPFSNSPTPSLSSSTIFSSKSPYDKWSPCKVKMTSINQLKGIRGATDSHAHTTEILGIRADSGNFSYATKMLQTLRSMIQKLEMVDPRRMRREEKLAFWINIHNALVMHAYLAYGTQNRANSRAVLKASYNIGGHCIDAYMIESSILGIRSHVSAPRIQSLFSSGNKYSKRASSKHEYALEYPEPLVHFAMCSGAYSDPVVRAYRAKNVFHELQIAKEEYIRANVCIKKDRIILPKILYHFAKDTSLDVPEIWGMVSKCMPEEAKKGFISRWSDKGIQWSAQCSTFRFVFHGGLSKDG